MKVLDAKRHKPLEGGASFTLSNRLFRGLWIVVWTLTARWTPPPLHAWRRFVLRSFGARVGRGVRLYGSTRVWYPPNLILGEGVLLGPGVNCYNQGTIAIGDRSVISQGAHLCASTHDISDPDFQLQLRPIAIGSRAWIAADAFVGPGCVVGDGAVLGARAALFGEAEPLTVYRGNPAQPIKQRSFRPK